MGSRGQSKSKLRSRQWARDAKAAFAYEAPAYERMTREELKDEDRKLGRYLEGLRHQDTPESKQRFRELAEMQNRVVDILVPERAEERRRAEEAETRAQREREAALGSDANRANRTLAAEEERRARASGEKIPYYVKYLQRPDKTMKDMLNHLSGVPKAEIVKRFPGAGLTIQQHVGDMASIIKVFLEEKGYREN